MSFYKIRYGCRAIRCGCRARKLAMSRLRGKSSDFFKKCAKTFASFVHKLVVACTVSSSEPQPFESDAIFVPLYEGTYGLLCSFIERRGYGVPTSLNPADRPSSIYKNLFPQLFPIEDPGASNWSSHSFHLPGLFSVGYRILYPQCQASPLRSKYEHLLPRR